MKPLIWLESDFNPWSVDDTQYSHDTSHNARAFYELSKFDGAGDDPLEVPEDEVDASWDLYSPGDELEQQSFTWLTDF